MESSFYFMILSKIVKVGDIVSILGFQFLIEHMVFMLLMNCTVVK